jgi:FecR protein
MKTKHITSSDMILVLSDLADAKTSDMVMLHVETCAVCRAEYESLIKSLSPDKNAGIPGPHVKEAIMSILSKKTAVVPFKARKLFLRVAIAASFAVLIPLIGFFIYTSRFSSEIAGLRLSEISGTIILNSKRILVNTQINNASVVESAANSSVQLNDANGMIVKIGQDAKLTLSYDRKYNRHLYILDRGTIIIESKHASSYMIASNGYTIRPVGTSYFVSNNESSVFVGVSDGSVSVRNDNDSSEVILIKNTLWASDNTSAVVSIALPNPPTFAQISQLYAMPVNKKGIIDNSVARSPSPENRKESDVKDDNKAENTSKSEKSDRREISQEKREIDRERKSRADQERGQRERRGR